MADKKISALTGASTPLAGTEVLPIVQSGSTVKVSVANLTAGRAVATAGGSFTDNIVQSTAAKGVNFTANTPAAGMTSQLLNWYEEGTWTPTVTFSTPGDTAVTYSAQLGDYTRVGNRVTANCYIETSAFTHTTASGFLIVTGLPVAMNATFVGSLAYSGLTVAGSGTYSEQISTFGTGAGTTVYFRNSFADGVTGLGYLSTANHTTGTNVVLAFTINYRVA